MTEKRYALGVDFGTLSARAVLVRLDGGGVEGSASFPYAHGVFPLPEGARESGRRLELQDPADYLEALETTVRQVTRDIDPAQIAGIGIDFTSCTCLPLAEDLTPLCRMEAFRSSPDAYVKLWRSTALEEGERVRQAAEARHVAWLRNTGGRVSAEWLLPKMLETMEHAPRVYEATAYYMEAGDWLVSLMCGEKVRSENLAAFKNFYLDGYPDRAFFRAVSPEWDDVLAGPLRGRVVRVGEKAGVLTKDAAARLGLCEGTPVAAAMTDAHIGVLTAGLTSPGDMLSIFGTSACHILQEDHEALPTGIAGWTRDGILPGLWSYEANQLMGDGFECFVQRFCPERVRREAEQNGESVYAALNAAVRDMKPGQSGLTVLDWFGGNRCVLGDGALTGVIAGLTHRTEPAEIWHALLEAAAFSMRMIRDNFTHFGLRVKRIVAMGGLANKNALLMQIVSDVLNQEIEICAAPEGAAQGSAIYAAAVSAYAGVAEAVRAMASGTGLIYRPHADAAAAYEGLYARFAALHDLLGREHPELIRR